MAIKSDLSADRERGAGYGQLRISGLGEISEPIDFSLMRNQGTQRFLGKGRIWQAAETWHAADEVIIDGHTAVIPVGPDVVDAIVGQPVNVVYRLTVATGTAKQEAPLKVHWPLLGSGAAAADESAILEQQRRQEEEARRRAAEEEARRQAAAEEEARQCREEQEQPLVQQETPPEPIAKEPIAKKSRLPVALLLLALLALAGSGVAWFGCLIPGFGPATCGSDPVLAEPPENVEPVKEAGLTCAGLTDGSACFQVAQKALEQKQLEPARQLFQHAASLGSIDANVAVARMYDPETWSAEASPATQASWETAVYWYEKAARQGDGRGQLAAGKLLCINALTEFEKSQGREYLEQAAKAGNAEAQTLLADCTSSGPGQ